LTQTAGTGTSCRNNLFYCLVFILMMWVVMPACLLCFPFVQRTYCFGSKADSQTLWWNIVRARNCPFFLLFCSLGAEHSDVGRYVCPPSIVSLRITHLLLRFEGGQTYIMVQHRDGEREPTIATFSSFLFLWWRSIMMWVVMSVRPQCFSFVSPISSCGSKADTHTL
jgi:hypothetical protein